LSNPCISTFYANSTFLQVLLEMSYAVGRTSDHDNFISEIKEKWNGCTERIIREALLKKMKDMSYLNQIRDSFDKYTIARGNKIELYS
jgi:hypothetical protein